MDTGQPRTRGALDKLLIGCGVGCGVLILAAVVAGGIGAFWFFSPGEQVATERIVGEESLGVVRMNELATDPGTQELLTKVGQALTDLNRRQQEAVLPDEMKWLTRFQRPTSAREFNRFIPKEATLVFEPAADADGAPELVFAANFRTMVRPIKAMIALMARGESAEGFRTEYRGNDVYLIPLDKGETAPVTFVGSTFLVASSRTSLERAVDRIVDGTAVGLEPLMRGAPEGTWDAVGTVPGVGEAAADLIRDLAPSAASGPPDGSALDLRFGVDVVSSDEISGEAVFDAGGAERARAWGEALAGGFEGLKARASEHGLKLDVRTEVRDGSVLAHLRLSGLEEAASTLIQIDVGDFSNDG